VDAIDSLRNLSSTPCDRNDVRQMQSMIGQPCTGYPVDDTATGDSAIGRASATKAFARDTYAAMPQSNMHEQGLISLIIL